MQSHCTIPENSMLPINNALPLIAVINYVVVTESRVCVGALGNHKRSVLYVAVDISMGENALALAHTRSEEHTSELQSR